MIEFLVNFLHTNYSNIHLFIGCVAILAALMANRIMADINFKDFIEHPFIISGIFVFITFVFSLILFLIFFTILLGGDIALTYWGIK